MISGLEEIAADLHEEEGKDFKLIAGVLGLGLGVYLAARGKGISANFENALRATGKGADYLHKGIRFGYEVPGLFETIKEEGINPKGVGEYLADIITLIWYRDPPREPLFSP